MRAPSDIRPGPRLVVASDVRGLIKPADVWDIAFGPNTRVLLSRAEVPRPSASATPELGILWVPDDHPIAVQVRVDDVPLGPLARVDGGAVIVPLPEFAPRTTLSWSIWHTASSWRHAVYLRQAGTVLKLEESAASPQNAYTECRGEWINAPPLAAIE